MVWGARFNIKNAQIRYLLVNTIQALYFREMVPYYENVLTSHCHLTTSQKKLCPLNQSFFIV